MRHIERWLGGILMLLLLTACSSSSDDEPQQQNEKPMLKILLFAPESPIVTRGSIGDVDALSQEERLIYSIDVWVFEHLSPDKKVGYIHQEGLSFDGQREISMEISDDFANLTNKPNVDIYVVANKESLAIGSSLGKETTMEQLKAACIGSADFGVSTTPLSVVPATGLPMSGLLENQKVLGIPPVYTAKANNVRLVRAVSKIRFAFSKSAPPAVAPTISDLSVFLKDNMLPNNEYIFLEGRYPTYTSHMVTTGDNAYNQNPVTFFSGEAINDINGCANPADYAYTTQTGQAYETLIQEGIDNNELKGFGPFYLHESDKKLKGTISYCIGSATTPTVREFEMGAAGDFTRNHTWIVYGYFLGSGELKLKVVDVKGWDLDREDPKVYNW